MSEVSADLHPNKKTRSSRKNLPPARWKFLLANRFPEPWKGLYIRLFRRLYTPLKRLPLFDELYGISVERFVFSYIQAKMLDAEGGNPLKDRQLRHLYREATRAFRAELRNLLRLCGAPSSKTALLKLAEEENEKRMVRSLLEVVLLTFRQELGNAGQTEHVMEALINNLRDWGEKQSRRRTFAQERSDAGQIG